MNPNQTYHIALNHPLIILGIYIVTSNAVNALIPPSRESTNFYRWFFNFSHAVLLQAGRFMTKETDGSYSGNNTTYGQLQGNAPVKDWAPFNKTKEK